MIQPSSLQNKYTLIWSGDPALELPKDPKERAAALTVAQERGDWTALLTTGTRPTEFHVEPIDGATWRWFIGEVVRRRLTEKEQLALAFRVAVVGIDNFGSTPYKIEFSRPDGIRVASLKVVADLDDALLAAGIKDGGLVDELGAAVVSRAQAVPPK